MELLQRIAAGVTQHSRLVIVTMVLLTVVLGAGMPMVSQSSSLDSFQSESSEQAQAQDYVSENFSSGEANTTTVQVIVKDDNVLSKKSLIQQLRLQQSLRDNGTVNATLSNESTTGVASIIAIATNQSERANELQQRGEQLKQRGDELQQRAKELEKRANQLNVSQTELQQRSEQLKQRGEKLRTQGEQLKQRAQQLNESRQELVEEGDKLEHRGQAFNESRQQLVEEKQALTGQAEQLQDRRESLTERQQRLIQRAEQLEENRSQLESAGEKLKSDFQELNESRQQLQQRRDELQNRGQEIEQNRTELDRRAQDIAEREQQLAEDRQSGNVSEEELQQRQKRINEDTAALESDQQALRERAAQLEVDRDQLEEDSDELKERADQLNQRKQKLQQQRAALGKQANELENDRDQLQADANEVARLADQLNQSRNELEERASNLESQANQLQRDRTELEQRGQVLEQRANQLREDQQKLEQQSQQLNESREALEEKGAALEQRAQELQNDSAALKEEQESLEADSQQLEADQRELQNQSPNLTLQEQISVLQNSSDSEIETGIEAVFGGSTTSNGVFAFMPSSYEPGDTSANATMLVATQKGGDTSAQTASDRITNSQLAIQEIAHDQYGSDDAMVFGAGIIAYETEQSMTDSLIIVGPLALLFVLLVLVIAYRDLLDILTGLFGIGLVLVWTFGFMGWAGIDFNQLFIAVPVLLIGLSIDYAIHVFMRHRETRENVRGVRDSMRSALGGIGTALVLVTLTAVIGFLSNLTSAVPPIREFGVVSAVGILSALFVFGLLVPALKVELDSFLESHGWSRNKRAVGTGGGTLGKLLSGGAIAARKAPYLVLIAAVLVTALGGLGATQVDTSFDQEDFLAENPSGVIGDLPEPFAPGEYHAKESMNFVTDQFIREDSNVDILIRGDVTDPSALAAIDEADAAASNESVTANLSNGESDITTPITVMEDVAAENESFNETYTEADTDSDGIPDQNVTGVYDALYDAAPDRAAAVIYRSDGEYEALDMSVSVVGDASGDAVTDGMASVADSIDERESVSAIATGQPIVFEIVQDQLMDTVIESLLLTLGVTFLFLMLVYRYLYGSSSLGFVTLLPVLFSVAWILGTMSLLGIPFNVITGLITSLTIGLGIAYSIHLSERYSLELQRGVSAWDALSTAVTGTGGALLGSAATTVGGFGVLAVAILPPLRQFGIITGLTIIYAFLASVVVLPSLLVLWTRWFGPNHAFSSASHFDFGSSTEEPTTDD